MTETIDFSKVKKLVFSDTPLADITNAIVLTSSRKVPANTILRYRDGTSDINNMTVGIAIALEGAANILEKGPIHLNKWRKAMTAFNHWQGPARVYLKKSTMTVETFVYPGPGQWEKETGDFVEIFSKATKDIRERDNQVTKRELERAAMVMIVKYV